MSSNSGRLLRLSHSVRSSLRRARVRRLSRFSSIQARSLSQWRISASWLTSTEPRSPALVGDDEARFLAGEGLDHAPHRGVVRHVDPGARVLAALAGRDEAHEQALGRRLLLGGQAAVERVRPLLQRLFEPGIVQPGRSAAPSASPRPVRARIRAAAACRCRIRRSGRTPDRGRCRG